MNRTALLIIFFIFSLEMISCSSSRRVRFDNKIVYHVFDSLENYIKNQIGDEQKICIIIAACPTCEKLIPKKESYKIFNLRLFRYTTENDFFDNDAKIMKRSNRFLQINGMLFPVLFLGIDDYFTSPIDSISLKNYSLYTRQARYQDIPVITVDLNQSVFYAVDDHTHLRGHISK